MEKPSRAKAGLSHMPNSVVSTEGRRPEWRDLFSTISYVLWREGLAAPRGVPTRYGKRGRVAISPCLSLLETGSRSADDEASEDANGSFSRRTRVTPRCVARAACWSNGHLALDVGVLRIGELAARKRDQHGRALAVAAILVAELPDQVALFQLDADQDVAGDHHREQQMANAHRRRGPDGQQDAEIDRVTDMPVEQRRAEFRVRQLFAEQAREHLGKPEQLEMTDQERAGHQHDPAQPEDAVEHHSGGRVGHAPDERGDGLPLPVQDQQREAGEQ